MRRIEDQFRAISVVAADDTRAWRLLEHQEDLEQDTGCELAEINDGYDPVTNYFWPSFRAATVTEEVARRAIRRWNVDNPTEVSQRSRDRVWPDFAAPNLPRFDQPFHKPHGLQGARGPEAFISCVGQVGRLVGNRPTSCSYLPTRQSALDACSSTLRSAV